MILIPLIKELKNKCTNSEKKIMRKLKLNASEYQAIDKIDFEAKITGNELAEIYKLSPSRSSRIIDKLAKRNIFLREEHGTDRRIKIISLSEKGINIKKEICEEKKNCEEKILNYFNNEEIDNIEKYLKKLIEIL